MLVTQDADQFISPGIRKALRNIWILFIVVFVAQFVTNYVLDGEDESLETVIGIINAATYSLVFLWYFVINKKWTSVLILLPFLLCQFYFLSDIKNTADYYIGFEKWLNSSTLKSAIDLIVKGALAFVLTKRYFMDEDVKTKPSLWKVVLLNFVIITLFYKEVDLLDQFLGSVMFSSEGMEAVFNIIYYLFSTLKDVSLLVMFYFILCVLIHKQSIYTFSQQALASISDTFNLLSIAILSCGIFSAFDLVQNSLTVAFDVIGKQYTLSQWFVLISAIAMFIISCRLLGQYLRYRSKSNATYYGVVGASITIPILNIISWCMVKYDQKMKFLSNTKLPKAKLVHLIIASVIMVYFYRDSILILDWTGILNCALFTGAIWYAARIKQYNWYFPLCLVAIYLGIKAYPLDGSMEGSFIGAFFKELYEIGFSLLLVIMTVILYGVYYIVYQTMNEKAK